MTEQITLLSVAGLLALMVIVRSAVGVYSEIWFKLRKAHLQTIYRPWSPESYVQFHEMLSQPYPWYVKADLWCMKHMF